MVKLDTLVCITTQPMQFCSLQGSNSGNLIGVKFMLFLSVIERRRKENARMRLCPLTLIVMN